MFKRVVTTPVAAGKLCLIICFIMITLVLKGKGHRIFGNSYKFKRVFISVVLTPGGQHIVRACIIIYNSDNNDSIGVKFWV